MSGFQAINQTMCLATNITRILTTISLFFIKNERSHHMYMTWPNRFPNKSTDTMRSRRTATAGQKFVYYNKTLKKLNRRYLQVTPTRHKTVSKEEQPRVKIQRSKATLVWNPNPQLCSSGNFLCHRPPVRPTVQRHAGSAEWDVLTDLWHSFSLRTFINKLPSSFFF